MAPPQFGLNFATIGAQNIWVDRKPSCMEVDIMTHRQAALAANMLDIIENCENGVPLTQIEELMGESISFAVLWSLVNYLWSMGLIKIENNSAYKDRS
jgi:predicted transcriptional regulator